MTLMSLWRTMKRSRREPTTVDLFRAGSRQRAPGRLDAALELPTSARALVLAGSDGAALAAVPDGAADGAARHVHRVTRLAEAILEHAGLGALREAVIEDAAGTTLLRTSEGAALSVTFR